jgi:hypothetical protein
MGFGGNCVQSTVHSKDREARVGGIPCGDEVRLLRIPPDGAVVPKWAHSAAQTAKDYGLLGKPLQVGFE